ncbi:hypothetical protein F5X96DRAFT_591727 [Biscogniauxia mediterranea]|nr:hypothetical protein F5X96DRAFT_591727 [Biscogniauxia mediterranea]
MEMTYNVAHAIWRPDFVIKYRELGRLLAEADSYSGSTSWVVSSLNPKNRPDSLDVSNSIWRVDGSTGCGTRFYAVLLDGQSNVTPLRIFVYLPDQQDYPSALRVCLDSASSVSLRDGKAISKLGISKHLCRALDYQCVQDPWLLKRYNQLPFGSRLVLEKVSAYLRDMRFTVVSNHESESATLTILELRRLWTDEVAEDGWPPILDITCLRLVRQIHDTVSIVKLDKGDQQRLGSKDRMVVFKSGIDNYYHTYHELHFLLTAAPHQNIMPRPLALVVKRSAFGGKLGVVGFLLKYFPCGSIRDIIPARQRAGTLDTRTKLRWCRQILSALIHIKEQCHTFFSDVRPDNVILDEAEGYGRLLLCDFEQRGNWYEWCAPEVRYRQYVENLRAAVAGKELKDARLISLLNKYTGAHVSSMAYTFAETPVQAKNRAWFALSPESQEKASVYTFGLFLYTIFEGLSNVQRNLVNSFPKDPEIEFPEFKHTPLAIRDLIMRCVATDDSLLPMQAERVVRVGGFMYPERQTDLEQNTEETIALVLKTAQIWWSTELARAEKFTETSEWQSGCFGTNRPTLRDVLRNLEALDIEDI